MSSRLIMLGPDCMGLVNFNDAVPLYPSRPSRRLRPGKVAIVAQSGSAAISVMNTILVGPSKVVTVGSKFHVAAADCDELVAALECAAVARKAAAGAALAIVGISGEQTALACDIAEAGAIPVAAFADATAAALRAALPGTPGANPVDFGATVNPEDRNFGAALAGEWRRTLGERRGALDPATAFGLLRSYGLPVVKSIVVRDADEAAARAREVGFPMVVKVASADIAHRSDVGGVVLDVNDETAPRSDASRRRSRRPGPARRSRASRCRSNWSTPSRRWPASCRRRRSARWSSWAAAERWWKSWPAPSGPLSVSKRRSMRLTISSPTISSALPMLPMRRASAASAFLHGPVVDFDCDGGHGQQILQSAAWAAVSNGNGCSPYGECMIRFESGAAHTSPSKTYRASRRL